MSQFTTFVRTRIRTGRGKAVALIVMASLAYAGVQTLYMKDASKSKPELQENIGAHHIGPDNFVTHASPRAVPQMVLQTNKSRAVSLRDYRGEWLVVNFWATWCAPCRKEMPQLDALAAHYEGQGVRVIALSVDRGGAAKPEKFLNELGVRHLTRLYDPSYKSARAAGLIGLPTTLLLNPDGQEVGRLAGEADWNSDQVHALLDMQRAK